MIYGVTLTDERLLQQYNLWSIGALGGRGRTELDAVLPFLALGAAAAILLARPLNALALGDDAARSLGAHVGRTRIGGAAAITLLCGGATAAAGPIWFLGLTVPHAARAICGPTSAGCSPTRRCSAPRCCWSPTCSAGSSCVRASCRRA